MILHTIVDSDSIFYQSNFNPFGEPGKPREVSLRRLEGNALLEGENTGNGVCVSRIISTNPQDYLNSSYQIGQAIK